MRSRFETCTYYSLVDVRARLSIDVQNLCQIGEQFWLGEGLPHLGMISLSDEALITTNIEQYDMKMVFKWHSHRHCWRVYQALLHIQSQFIFTPITLIPLLHILQITQRSTLSIWVKTKTGGDGKRAPTNPTITALQAFKLWNFTQITEYMNIFLI